jgi:hypothetical protein
MSIWFTEVLCICQSQEVGGELAATFLKLVRVESERGRTSQVQNCEEFPEAVLVSWPNWQHSRLVSSTIFSRIPWPFLLNNEMVT